MPSAAGGEGTKTGADDIRNSTGISHHAQARFPRSSYPVGPTASR
jgi:hypothetical protein